MVDYKQRDSSVNKKLYRISDHEVFRERNLVTKSGISFATLVNRWHEADLMAMEIWERFSENDDVKALKWDPGMSFELAQVCRFHSEKARMVNNEEDEDLWTKKALCFPPC